MHLNGFGVGVRLMSSFSILTYPEGDKTLWGESCIIIKYHGASSD